MLAPSLDSTASNSFEVLLGGTGTVSCLRIGPTSNLPRKSKANSNTITDYFLRSLCSSTWMFTYHKDGFCLFFRPHVWLVGSYRPDQGSNLGPLWWKRGTLTTGLPGTPPTRVAQPRPWMWPAATGKGGMSVWKRVSNISMLLISLEFIN